MEIPSNFWIIYLSAMFKKGQTPPPFPEVVYGPNGSQVDEFCTVSFQVQIPETGLWAIKDRAFPGERFRVVFASRNNALKGENLRMETEREMRTNQELEIKNSLRRLDEDLQKFWRILYIMLLLITASVGFNIGWMIWCEFLKGRP